MLGLQANTVRRVGRIGLSETLRRNIQHNICCVTRTLPHDAPNEKEQLIHLAPCS